jgi:hypothetical protein
MARPGVCSPDAVLSSSIERAAHYTHSGIRDADLPPTRTRHGRVTTRTRRGQPPPHYARLTEKPGTRLRSDGAIGFDASVWARLSLIKLVFQA